MGVIIVVLISLCPKSVFRFWDTQPAISHSKRSVACGQASAKSAWKRSKRSSCSVIPMETVPKVPGVPTVPTV